MVTDVFSMVCCCLLAGEAADSEAEAATAMASWPRPTSCMLLILCSTLDDGPFRVVGV